MPLSPYQFQPSTPKSGSPSPRQPGSGHSRNFSSGSWSSSPESAATHATTPSASPLRHYGPCLLPQIRSQDQILESESTIPSYRRTQSHEPEIEPTPAYTYQPEYQRSTTSPPEFTHDPVPTSATSSVDPFFSSGRQSPVIYSAQQRRNLSHGRSVSSSSVEAAALRRACPPIYRPMPVYVTQQSPQYTPALTPGLEDFVSIPLAAPSQPLYRELTPELRVETGDEPTSTICKYLTEANPAVNLVPTHFRGYGDGNPKHCWWDVRNLRPWEDFSVDKIMDVDILNGLLNVDVNSAALPKPDPLSTTGANPQDLPSLAMTIENFHVAKVNAALRVVQGADHHLVMKPARTSQDGPHFIANFANDSEASMGGNGRGRVVGLVKPYEQWNTGKRNTEKRDEKCQAGVEYLRHLAHLQVLMRAHNCRYGFIITEIELVCVRLGTEEGAPNFGFLEMSNPIPMKAHDRGKGAGSQRMTACLALWYLHMLAGDSPLPGQALWKIDVGPPAAWTRSKVLKEGLEGRDSWMPKVTQAEIRHANTLRGWAWPEDKIHRAKEGVNPGRGGRR